jgi:hypothetical protein
MLRARTRDAAANASRQPSQREVDAAVEVFVYLLHPQGAKPRPVGDDQAALVTSATRAVDVAQASIDAAQAMPEATQVLVDLALGMLDQALRMLDSGATNVNFHGFLRSERHGEALWS